jgi:hypothetical protein
MIRKLIMTVVVTIACLFASAVELAIKFPLNRVALQTNESVPVAVIRSNATALTADTLVATITGENGSKLRFTFAVPAVDVVNNSARNTQHFNIDARLLKPGNYILQVDVNGVTATTPFEVYSNLRRSTFKLINWGSPAGAANQKIQGEGDGGLGYNLMYDKPADITEYIRAGVDVMPVNIMGGGHQMELRSECDWSDPYVILGGTRKATRAAFQYRMFPNFIGLNFYDEPGLTWGKHPDTGEWTPHGIPSQMRSYESAFNKSAIQYNKVDPVKADDVSAWKDFGSWKLGFMDAAWRESAYGVNQVKPGLINNTQSQYGWSAFTDGYYFNVTRSLNVASGHGGYDDLSGGYYCPSYFLEMARARDRARPNWYLPTWYRNITDDNMRVENYLSFAVGIQGIMTPPWIEPTGKTPSGKAAIIETNRVMGRLGTIFNTMPNTPKQVAMLYSMSNNLDTQSKDRTVNYAHGYKHGARLVFGYLAGLISQQPVDAIVDEDIIDGTLQANHKAVLLTSIDYLEPKVIRGLEQFIANGGIVLQTADSTVQVKGAINLGVAPGLPDQAAFDALHKEIMASPKRDWSRLNPYITVGKYLEGATSLAKAMSAQLIKAGIKPIFETDQPEVIAQRHAAGDVEYIFAINTTNDRAKGTTQIILPVTAKITLTNDGRPVYDAMTGENIKELKATKKELSGSFNFGPGQMRVFARTARPIGGVNVGTPVVSSDFTRETNPIQFSFSASLVDTNGQVLSGSVPMRVQVIDPILQARLDTPKNKSADVNPVLVNRYDLYRATTDGVLQIALPLAANDAAGKWTVIVTELLSNKSATSSFIYKPSTRNANIVGGVSRAIMLDGEEENLFRFVRENQSVTIVAGTGDYKAAVERLQKMLTPWGVKATIMDVATAYKARTITEEEAPTWVGIEYTSRGSIKVGDANSPLQAGLAVQGAMILLGTPEDNAIIKMIQGAKFLPMVPKVGDFPGRNRGFIAWQREAIGPRQESVTLIANDITGMNEAVGTFYEAAAGIQPLTRWTLPDEAEITPANK